MNIFLYPSIQLYLCFPLQAKAIWSLEWFMGKRNYVMLDITVSLMLNYWEILIRLFVGKIFHVKLLNNIVIYVELYVLHAIQTFGFKTVVQYPWFSCQYILELKHLHLGLIHQWSRSKQTLISEQYLCESEFSSWSQNYVPSECHGYHKTCGN